MSATLRSRQEKILFTHRRDLVHYNAETKKAVQKRRWRKQRNKCDWAVTFHCTRLNTIDRAKLLLITWTATGLVLWMVVYGILQMGDFLWQQQHQSLSLTLTRINSWRVWKRNTTCIEWHRCYEHLRPISTAISCAWKSKKNRVEWILFIRRKNPGCAKMSWEDGC